MPRTWGLAGPRTLLLLALPQPSSPRASGVMRGFPRTLVALRLSLSHTHTHHDMLSQVQLPLTHRKTVSNLTWDCEPQGLQVYSKVWKRLCLESIIPGESTRWQFFLRDPKIGDALSVWEQA